MIVVFIMIMLNYQRLSFSDIMIGHIAMLSHNVIIDTIFILLH